MLTSKLSADALAVKGQFGDTMGMVMQVLTSGFLSLPAPVSPPPEPALCTPTPPIHGHGHAGPYEWFSFLFPALISPAPERALHALLLSMGMVMQVPTSGFLSLPCTRLARS